LERKNSSGFDETISPYHYRYPSPLVYRFSKKQGGGISTEKFIKFAGRLCPPPDFPCKNVNRAAPAAGFDIVL